MEHTTPSRFATLSFGSLLRYALMRIRTRLVIAELSAKERMEELEIQARPN